MFMQSSPLLSPQTSQGFLCRTVAHFYSHFSSSCASLVQSKRYFQVPFTDTVTALFSLEECKRNSLMKQKKNRKIEKQSQPGSLQRQGSQEGMPISRQLFPHTRCHTQDDKFVVATGISCSFLLLLREITFSGMSKQHLPLPGGHACSLITKETQNWILSFAESKKSPRKLFQAQRRSTAKP